MPGGAKVPHNVGTTPNVPRETMGKIALVAYATLKGMGWRAKLHLPVFL